MTYELRPDETVGDGIQRIVCHQIEGAIRASSAEQNVGQLISEVRDAEVRLQTVRQLREFARGKKRSFRETEELLAFELDSFLAAFSEWPEEAKQRLTQLLNRIRGWPLDDLSCKQLRKCVQKTYKRGRQSLEAAIEKTSTKNLHTFRKRAKELWYQLRILRPLAPAVFRELNDELKTIGEYLGQIHDLAFVAERLSSIRSARKQGDRILKALISFKGEGARADGHCARRAVLRGAPPAICPAAFAIFFRMGANEGSSSLDWRPNWRALEELTVRSWIGGEALYSFAAAGTC